MSDKLLYHGWGVWGYRVTKQEFKAGRCHMEIIEDSHRLRCPLCGSRDIVRRGRISREFLAPPIGRKPVILHYEVPRIECMNCGAVRQVRLPFAEEHHRCTRSFERYVLDLSKEMSILGVSRHLGIGWEVVKEIQKRYLGRRFRRIPLRNLRRIAIDEIAEKKGHKYLAIVLDLDTGAVVFVGDGKGASALEPFWAKLRRLKVHLEAAATDMSSAYFLAVMKNQPEATLVFDHFHVTKLFNEKLDKLRRNLMHDADNLGKKMLKGTRWLLMKNAENLNEAHHELERLQEALNFNKPLAEAYFMKEQFRLFWEQPDKESARRFLETWATWAEESANDALRDMAHTIRRYRFGLLSWYDCPISTAALEGTNNKIKTMKRQAYGFRDREFFKLKILAIHESKYELVG